MISAGTAFAASDDAALEAPASAMISVDNGNGAIDVTLNDELIDDGANDLVNTRFNAADNEVFARAEVADGDADYPIFLTTTGLIPKLLSNKTVEIAFDDGEFVKYTTNLFGEVNYVIPEDATAGSYTIYMNFNGDDKYADCFLANNIEIVDIDTEILALANVSYARSVVTEGLAYYPIALTTNTTIPIPLANRTVIIEYDQTGGEFKTNALGIINYRFYDPLKGAGNYTIKIEYPGEDGFSPAYFETNVEIYDVESRIIAIENASYATPVVAEGLAYYPIALTTGGTIPIPLANKTFTLKFGEDEFEPTTNAFGVYNYVIDPSYTAGNYSVYVYYDGEEEGYFPAEFTTTVEIYDVETKILALENVSYPRSLVVEGLGYYPIALTTNSTIPIPLANKSIIISFGGDSFETVTNELGIYNYVIDPAYPEGEYTINVFYEGDDGYVPTKFTTTITLYDVETKIVAGEDSIYPRILVKEGIDYYPIALTTNSTIPVPLANKTISVKFNGAAEEYTTNALGIVNFTLGDIPTGEYDIEITYAGDDGYVGSDFATTISVVDIPVEIHALDNITYKYSDVANGYAFYPIFLTTDVIPIPLGNKTIIVEYDQTGGEFTTSSLGFVNYKIFAPVEKAAGNYTITVYYGGEDGIASATSTGIIEIIKDESVISAEDVTAFIGDLDAKLVINLTNSYGKPLTSANIKVNINGEKVSLKTNKQGQAELSLADLPEGTYTAQITYGGNKIYEASSTTAEITVLPNKTSTAISLYYDREAKELVATITTDTGRAISGANVVFNVKGVKTIVKSKSGISRLAIGEDDLDLKSASVSYGGNYKYFKSTASIKIAEDKIATSVSNAYDEEAGELVVTLINADTGKTLRGANVVFKLNGVLQDPIKTDQNGQARLPVTDLLEGIVTFVSSYGGNSKYTASTASIIFLKD